MDYSKVNPKSKNALSQRDNVTGIIVGRKAQGKSTKIRQIVDRYPSDKRVLIVDVNNSPAYQDIPRMEVRHVRHWRKGVYKINNRDKSAMLWEILEYVRNALVVFEDCTKYIKGNVGEEVISFLVDQRMYNLDLLFTFHSVKRIPPQFWEMTNYLVLFKTNENIDTPRNRNVIPNYEAVQQAFERIKNAPAVNGRIQYHETIPTDI